MSIDRSRESMPPIVGRRKHSCSFCRKKKVKCDGNSPCSTCVRFQNRCDFKRDIKVNAVTQHNIKILRLKNLPMIPKAVLNRKKLKTKELMLTELRPKKIVEGDTSHVQTSSSSYRSSPEYIKFSDQEVRIIGKTIYNRQYFAPLSWVTLRFIDRYSSLLFRYFMKASKDFKTVFEDSEVYKKEGKYFKEMKGLTIVSQTDQNTRIQPLVSLILTHADTEYGDQNITLLDKIRCILPRRNLIVMLLNRFFTCLYPLMPLVDQFEFERSLDQIIVDLDILNGTVEIIIREEADFAP